jgi:tripartite-type tricarboxylate transporter receptor subunit TctC
LPTTKEAGVPGFEIDTWYALYAPTGTPPDVIGLLAGEAKRIAGTDELKSRVDQSGATIDYIGPRACEVYRVAGHLSTAVIRKLGITAQ